MLTYTDQILNEPWSDLDKSDAGLNHKLDLVYELQQDYNFGGNTVGDLSLSTMQKRLKLQQKRPLMMLVKYSGLVRNLNKILQLVSRKNFLMAGLQLLDGHNVAVVVGTTEESFDFEAIVVDLRNIVVPVVVHVEYYYIFVVRLLVLLLISVEMQQALVVVDLRIVVVVHAFAVEYYIDVVVAVEVSLAVLLLIAVDV